MTEPTELVIGVDGGGTKTVAWLADQLSGQVFGRGQSGPSNPRAAGFDVAQANIEAAIEAAFADAQRQRCTVSAACLCLSGAGRLSEQQRLIEWTEGCGLARAARVTGDAEPILAAASPENFGIALISGTGSLAWGRNRSGEVSRSGGWGYLLGDEGSGYVLALSGLRAAVRAADGRGPATELLVRLQETLQATTAADFIERVYGPDMTRERLAALAVVVFEAACGDAVACEIVDRAADDLAEMVATLARQLSLSPNQYPLAMSGSVLLHQEPLRNRVAERLVQRQAVPREFVLVTEPVSGAVSLARQM